MQLNKATGEAADQPKRFRAVEYIRISTEHQQYSTENQADKIREYAAHRNIDIVHTYPWKQVALQLPNGAFRMACAPLGGLFAIPLQGHSLKGVVACSRSFKFFDFAHRQRIKSV